MVLCYNIKKGINMNKKRIISISGDIDAVKGTVCVVGLQRDFAGAGDIGILAIPVGVGLLVRRFCDDAVRFTRCGREACCGYADQRGCQNCDETVLFHVEFLLF